jgi:hypothetical protein
MPDEKKAESVTPVTPADHDEETSAFEALLRDIAELRDPDTLVEHMEVDTYRKGKRA